MPTYTLDLTDDYNGTWLVTCHALPELTTFVEDIGELDRIASGAADEALAARLTVMDAIPPDDVRGPRLVRPSLQIALKAELARALAEEGLTRADLMRRLGWKRPAVDRLFDPGHAGRLANIEAAFGALGRAARLHVSRAA